MARVSVSKTSHRMYQDVTRRENGRALFDTMKDFFMFNFAIGVRNGVMVKIESGVDVFPSETFSTEDVVAMYGIYLARTKDLTALEPGLRSTAISQPVLATAEQFANAGAAITAEHLTPRDPEKALAFLLLEPQG